VVYLYCIKPDKPRKLVATFDTEEQLLAYVRWATLQRNEHGNRKFEQGSALVGCTQFEYAAPPRPVEVRPDVPHNPSPSML
jgi:hypothetical protein